MDQFVGQNPYLFYAIAVALALVVAWFIRKYFQDNINALREVTGSISDLYAKYNNHETRLSHLEGEHKVFSKLKGHGE
jgi:hypothetical protein